MVKNICWVFVAALAVGLCAAILLAPAYADGPQGGGKQPAQQGGNQPGNSGGGPNGHSTQPSFPSDNRTRSASDNFSPRQAPPPVADNKTPRLSDNVSGRNMPPPIGDNVTPPASDNISDHHGPIPPSDNMTPGWSDNRTPPWSENITPPWSDNMTPPPPPGDNVTGRLDQTPNIEKLFDALAQWFAGK